MKNERLFEIVWLLMKKKMVSAKELANHFEVSVRTIYRDIETLSMANIPIYTQQGKNGGIALMDHFILDKTILNEEEQKHIIMSLQSSGFDQKEKDQTLLKLSSIFSQDTIDWIEVDFSNWNDPKREQDYFEQIKKSIFSNLCIQLEYMSSNGEVVSRIVEPHKLYFRGQAWYLYAFCQKREAFRYFKLMRIRKFTVLEETFKRKVIIEEKNKKINKQLVESIIKINKSISYRVLEELHPYIIKEDKLSFYVKLTMDEEGLFYYLMSFAEDAELMEPIELRRKMQKRIEKLHFIYKYDT